MSAKVLLLHISDLHFGARYLSGRRRSLPQGLQPHDLMACDDLELVWKQLIWTERPKLALVVVSGDLTLMGLDAEFCVANTFIRGRIHSQWNLASGLGGTADQQWAVPGNHDHWGGRLNPLFVLQQRWLHGSMFPRLSNRSCWAERYDDIPGLQLMLMGLDSNAGPHADPFAKGSIDPADLKELEDWMNDFRSSKDQREVRILVMHHSRHFPGVSSKLSHELDVDSQSLLHDFLRDQRINFVFTGHMHEPIVPRASIPPTGLELRCGTTLQRSRSPKSLPSAAGHTFLLHSAELREDQVHWESRLFSRKDPALPFIEQEDPYTCDF